MKLARTALAHSQNRSYFPQTEFSGIAQPDYGAVTVRQTRDFLIENRQPLVVRQQAIGRMFGRRRNLCFQIDHVVRIFAGPREADWPGPGTAPHSIQHLAPDAELRVSRERYAALRLERSFRLQKADVSCLDEIRHFETGTSGKTGKDPARDRTNQSIHFVCLRRGFICQYCSFGCQYCGGRLSRNGLVARMRRSARYRSFRAGCRDLRHQSKQWRAPGTFSSWLIGILSQQR